MLSKVGDQTPEIPLVDVVGKVNKLSPKQTGLIGLKVGTILGEVMVTVNVNIVAHCPEFGVKT